MMGGEGGDRRGVIDRGCADWWRMCVGEDGGRGSGGRKGVNVCRGGGVGVCVSVGVRDCEGE